MMHAVFRSSVREAIVIACLAANFPYTLRRMAPTVKLSKTGGVVGGVAVGVGGGVPG